ncbi:hypothetical protein GH714_002673 [Hevea brasiliensis]|uniref:Pentatricopeptide repeat-containing protein n=1 Tax=Hevea brasiliensis TaxID=3981 RepID=A0A6A6M746_HEVBR|nr:hypothetical protein GH714_002673 [Hevea brasiliensis]
MRSIGIRPNSHTFRSLIKCCVCLSSLDQVHGQILKFGHMSDYYITSAVVNMYSKCEAKELARQVFDESIDLNVVCWTSLASGYCSNGLMNETDKMFDAMPERNEISCRAMVSAIGAFEDGKWIHSYVDGNGLD